MKCFYKIILFGILFFLTAESSFSQANSWVKKNSFVGAKRERGVGIRIGDRGYVGLGHDSGNVVLNDWWEYDPATDSWTQKANLPGSGRRNAAAFSIGTKGYVGTGDNSNNPSLGTPLFDFYEYNAVTNVWSPKASYPGNFNSGIYYATGFAINNRGYFCCGKIGPANYSNELWQYDPVNDLWTNKAPYPGGLIYGASSFSCGNFGFVGLGVDMQVLRKDWWKYDPSLNQWTRVNDLPSSARFISSSFSIGSEGFVVCGDDGGYKSELWEYSSTYNIWVQRADFSGGTRIEMAAFSIGGKGYAGTGKSLSGSKRDLWEYTPLAPLGINDASYNTTLNIFPDPMIDEAELIVNSSSTLKNMTMNIFDVSGKLLRTQTFTGSEIKIERNDLPSGIYFVSVSDEKEIHAVSKLIIQ